MMSLHGETIDATRSCIIFRLVFKINTSVALSEAAPSSAGRFVDASAASFSAACNVCAAATQVACWISRPSSRKQSHQKWDVCSTCGRSLGTVPPKVQKVGRLLDLRTGPRLCARSWLSGNEGKTAFKLILISQKCSDTSLCPP